MAIAVTQGECGSSKDLLSKLPAQKVEPLWTVMQSMVMPRPAPQAEICLWKYSELRPLLLEAGKTVSSEQAERRVLMLVNPSLSKFVHCSSYGAEIDSKSSSQRPLSPPTRYTQACN